MSQLLEWNVVDRLIVANVKSVVGGSAIGRRRGGVLCRERWWWRGWCLWRGSLLIVLLLAVAVLIVVALRLLLLLLVAAVALIVAAGTQELDSITRDEQLAAFLASRLVFPLVHLESSLDQSRGTLLQVLAAGLCLTAPDLNVNKGGLVAVGAGTIPKSSIDCQAEFADDAAAGLPGFWSRVRFPIRITRLYDAIVHSQFLRGQQF